MVVWTLSAAMLLVTGATALAQPVSPTFNKDVAPLLWAHCATCHRAGQSAPFSLVTFEEVRPYAQAIVRAVVGRTMPPWKPEPGYGDFAGMRRLSAHEISTLQMWADGGFRRGEEGDLPPLPKWSDGWQFGEPDLVVTMVEAYELAPTGSDTFRTFVMTNPATGRRYVKAWELKSEPPVVVHHANIKIDRTLASRVLDEQDPAPGYDGGASRQSEFPDGHFLGWTPGQSPRVLPDDMAWHLEAGSDLVVETHLMPAAQASRVRLRVGLYFSDTPPSRIPYTLRLSRQDIDIAPGERVVLSDSFVLPVSVDVLSVQPHAHYLATEVRAFAALPDGTSEGLILIKNWDFHWQDNYRYRTPLRLPRGTTLTLRYTYDNTTANLRNPHRPPQRITFGQTTASEMASLWVQVVPENARDRQILDGQFTAKLLRDDIDGYRKMLEITPTHARVHSALAHAYAEAGRHEDAMAHFEHTIRLDPTSAGHYDLATMLLAAEQWHAASIHFTEALRLKPSFAEAWFGLAAAHHRLGHIDEAIDAYRRSMGLGLRYRDAHYNLARALTASGQSSAAIIEYRRALEIDPLDAEAHSGLGAAMAADNQVGSAVAHYRAALAIAPELPSALIDLAWILATTDRTDARDPLEAVRLAERVAAITNHANASALDTLAVAYGAAGQLDRAIATAEAAERLARQAGQNDLADRIKRRLDLFARNR